ncbi:hypothetical protein P153DRAFT_355796 [Dothidotthia symphoricarpi CBS 119687]|uniref:Phosphatidate phosphatase APP1 catalytic domain-containing protein n=1 Tax=Dothidotthia symphoricarpi CBS 119687 TaxID=1392245 RepID=A0A6A6AHH4_9PLEO|nr:uncharacterized protein P153DRAFT_355796 [Dothidotthia symphoricarpi CBS 119687]KAF2131006.1 hypothetical protein P153DRAFT_355796 [Dothidotthia symphoricarpi CBS 119687]
MAALARIFKNKWITPPQPVTEDYSGRCIIVTGATSGIGKEAAFKFAALGAAKVIIAARDLKKGEVTKAALEHRLGTKDQFEVWELDMMSYDSVIAFAERANGLDHLDIAVLNAGIQRVAYAQSGYGWEEDLQVNTLSTTLLAVLLLPKLRISKQPAGKIPVLEFVNSGLHQNAVVPSEVRQEPSILDYYNKSENFKESRQYGFSKVFLMYVANKLADEVSSGDVIVTSICPGLVNTNLGRDHFFPGLHVLFSFFIFLFMRTPSQGANMILSGTTQGESVHGRFWQHDQIQPIAPSVAGSEMKAFGVRVWGEVLAVLKKDVPEILPFRRKSAHGYDSLLRFLFPQTRARARARLSEFRHTTVPSLKHRAQSRIYKYILHRQATKLKGTPSILQRLRGQSRRLLGSNHLEHEARRRRKNLVNEPGSSAPSQRTMGSQDGYSEREGGSRRRKLAGYFKAANELRQTYQQQYAPNFSGREATYDYEDDTPGSFPDAAIVRSGEEDMILFPSYARRHIKRKPEAQPGTIQEAEGEGRDVRDTAGAGDAEFWKQQWNNYEDDNAVVDVDVRGWIYSPHKGNMSRKQRLFIGLARQLVGISAPPAAASASNSAGSSRDPSPGHGGLRERAEMRQAQRDAELQAKEAEAILRKGQKEAEAAARGAYSERPGRGEEDDTLLYRTESSNSVRTQGTLSHMHSNSSLRDEANITPLKKRASWNQPADMNAAELAEANARLMARLRHFLAVPMANAPISVFFYNDKISKQRTVYTNAAGHFSVSAALDFVPTHVRILASEQLSATEEVLVTESEGISVISDIDDTIKHSAISSGAREIFRNAFIRELGDLTIDGVKEWYNDMAKMGVKFHYVSNSPWQLFPVISKYFALAGLPPGSFHLKQYSGMMQGIFEPVAERKKVTLDKIARDFPERSFILIGDSGEADLEVYTDFVLENPGRVVAVFIRDVTTADSGGFFDPSVAPMSGDRSSSSSQYDTGGGVAASRRAQASRGDDDDPELKAAITASLQDLEEDNLRRSKSMFPQVDRDHPDLRPNLPNHKPTSQISSQRTPQTSMPNLIDLSPDEEPVMRPTIRRVYTDTDFETEKHRISMASDASMRSAPPRPKKPETLRSDSGDLITLTPASASSTSKAPRPPKPRRPSTTIKQSSPLIQQTAAPSKPSVAPKPDFSTQSQSESDSQSTYAGMARDKLWSVYSNLPSLSSQEQATNAPPAANTGMSKKAPPPPPPRRGVVAAVGNKASSAWQYAPSRPHLTSSQTQQPFSTSSAQQKLNRTSTSTTLGLNGTEGQYVNKRELMWRQRWARAEEIMADRGVVLRTWRVGSDAVAETEQIIRRYEKRNKGNEGKLEDRSEMRNSNGPRHKKAGGSGGGKGDGSRRSGGTSTSEHINLYH